MASHTGTGQCPGDHDEEQQVDNGLSHGWKADEDMKRHPGDCEPAHPVFAAKQKHSTGDRQNFRHFNRHVLGVRVTREVRNKPSESDSDIDYCNHKHGWRRLHGIT